MEPKPLYERPGTGGRLVIIGQTHSIYQELSQEIIDSQLAIYHLLTDLRAEGFRLVLAEGMFAATAYTIRQYPKRRRSWKFWKRAPPITTGRALDRRGFVARLQNSRRPRLVDAKDLAYYDWGYNVQGFEDYTAYKANREFHFPRLQASAERAAAAGERNETEQRLKEKHDGLRRGFDYFKRLRSGYALLNAPTVVERELAAGRTPNANAALIIGSAHLDEMIAFLDEGSVRVPEQHIASHTLPAFEQSLAVPYEVTVISTSTGHGPASRAQHT